MKLIRWYIAIMVLLIVIYMIAEYHRPKPVNWAPTYSNKDKIPYGTYIVYNELKAFFNGVGPVELREPLYELINNSSDSGLVLIYIKDDFEISSADTEELHKFISNGNTVFISSERYVDTFKKKFKIEMGDSWFNSVNDSVTINLLNPSLRAFMGFGLARNTMDAYFSRVDSANSTVLGDNSNGKHNFVRTRLGKGVLYLHAAPQAFSNYFALKDRNLEYINKVISYLPADASIVYWDEYSKQGLGQPQTELRVILQDPWLRWAYYLAVLGLLIYVIFQYKRRQRIIPVMIPPKNDSKEFVETVSRVYFNQKHHLNIAEKKVNHWLDFVRTRLGVSTRELNSDFAKQVSHRTAVPEQDVLNILSAIEIVRVRPAISAEELIRINKLIDNFYKQAK